MHEWISRNDLNDELAVVSDEKIYHTTKTHKSIQLDNVLYLEMLTLLQLPNIEDDRRVEELSSAFYLRNGLKVIYTKGTFAKIGNSFFKVVSIFRAFQTPMAICQHSPGQPNRNGFVELHFNFLSPSKVVRVQDLSRPTAYYKSPSDTIIILNDHAV